MTLIEAVSILLVLNSLIKYLKKVHAVYLKLYKIKYKIAKKNRMFINYNGLALGEGAASPSTPAKGSGGTL